MFPNITGQMTALKLKNSGNFGWNGFVNSPWNEAGATLGTSSGTNMASCNTVFNASHQNSCFGTSDAIQVASIRSLALIRAY